MSVAVMCRQLDEVDSELEVHRKTERELHEKVMHSSSSCSCYNINFNVPVTVHTQLTVD